MTDPNEFPQPMPGTYAFTARLLAQAGFMSGEEADEWKEAMKEADLHGE